MSDASSSNPSERKQDGWPAPDGSQPSQDSTPTAAWNANSTPHQQWNQAVSSPPASPAAPSSGAGPQPPQWDTPTQQAYWNQPSGAWASTPTSVPPGAPHSGAPHSGAPHSGAGWGQPTQFPGEVIPQYQPRIEPTPPKGRSPVLPLLLGVLIGAVVAGAGGFFLGSATGSGEPSPETSTAPAAAVPLFDSVQAAANKAKLDGELAGLAGPWLTSAMGDCVSNVDKDAPDLPGDQSRHVTCRYGSAWIHFMVYQDADKKSAARNYRQQLNLNSDEVTPGVQDPSRTTGGVSGAQGKMIEYSFRLDDGRSLCGISWERDEDPLAALMIEAHCEEALGGKWEPLRDLWQRHS
ncbi:hypothetical protein [Paractinoplanes rishiriensis]|uniref:hypothetical protein n=1 Tax=Paractinoplanes rishiriensis TaxID=1050105 RepID=UPI001943C90A|nr:hypothetical protein [Actinoplanes rishiriensis]